MQRRSRIQTWEYVAGLYDGEGTFAAYKKITSKPNGVGAALAINVTQSIPHRIVIDELARFLTEQGIGFSTHVAKRDNPKHNSALRLQVHNARAALKFLNLCIPHLVLKQKEAKAVRKVVQGIVGRQDDRVLRVATAIKEYQEGGAKYTVCKRNKLCQWTFINELQKAGVPVRTASEAAKNARKYRNRMFWHRDLEGRIDQAIKLREDGWSLRAISRELHMERSTMRKYFALKDLRHLIPIRRNSPPLP